MPSNYMNDNIYQNLFQKSSKIAKFIQFLHAVVHICYKQNRCAEVTITYPMLLTLTKYKLRVLEIVLGSY